MPAKKTTAQFIEDARKVHGDRYDYSLVEYVDSKSKVKIICASHGMFELEANAHTSQGQGCKLCGYIRNSESKKLGVKVFIQKAKATHRDKYDYSLVEYIRNDIKVKIICKEHGVFQQKPMSHMVGHGCGSCTSTYKLTTNEFIKRACKVHGDKYDYSQVEYVNSVTKVKIICASHGMFKQVAGVHVLQAQGCPKCNASKGENKIWKYLMNSGISFKTQKRFLNCRHKHPLPFDFYIPHLNLLIEFDGEQHFNPNPAFGGEKALKATQKKDTIKTVFAKEHGFNLLRIPYTEYDRIEEILSEALKLEYQPLQLSLFAA
jgi:very-short-patch-repair endonuclease